jgi:hypothetical protein
VDLNVSAQDGDKAVGNSSYAVGNNHTISAKSQSIDVEATQKIDVGAKMEQTTPNLIAAISGTFKVTSGSAVVKIDAAGAEIAAEVLKAATSKRDITEEGAEIGTYTLNTGSAQIQAQKALAMTAGSTHTVNAAVIKAEGAEGILMSGSTVTVAGGMVVFKGSSVMLNGAV